MSVPKNEGPVSLGPSASGAAVRQYVENAYSLQEQTTRYLEGAKSRAMKNGIVLTDQLLIEVILATLSK